MERLQKYLANQGLCSRRQAEEWICNELVTVNGITASLGQKIDPSKDKVQVNNQPVHRRPRITLAMNKPKGVLCSHRDPHFSHTVMDLLPPQWRPFRLSFAGRLDKESEGLLILTNDGELIYRLTHPSNEVLKRYRIALHKPFPQKKIPLLLKGIDYEGEHLFAHKIISLKDDESDSFEVHLTQGRKREIRRLFEAFGCYVKKLKRFQIGDFILHGLPPGASRPLKPWEITLLQKK